MAVKQWIVADCDKDLAAHFAQKYSLNPFAALLAVSRGLRTDEEIGAFFHPDTVPLSDPFSFRDMDKAVARINDAIDRFERIAVFGDYDADGVTATALLCAYLAMREADFFYMLPDRTEGYGLNEAVIDRLHEQGARLVITVDNGINAVEETAYAKRLGMDLVITDHHHVGDVLPDAAAVVNPHRADCNAPFKELAGVGVAFKLVCALEGGDADDLLDEFADLVAIGTVADVVPLKGENRVLVRRGIRAMLDNPRPGILAMRESAGNLDKPFNSTTVAFTLSPRLNAVGRMGSAMRALDILLCEDEDTAADLAKIMEQTNAERQQTETDIFEKAQAQLLEHPERLADPVLVCSGEGWHPGVIGIVASRMVEKFGKPCLILSCCGSVARGSGRSLEGFSLYDALKACEDVLEQFGGHTLAAGMSVKPENIELFRQRINDYARTREMPFPIQHIDMRLNPRVISTEILEALSALEPFGANNPRPVFGLYGMRLDSVTPLAGGKHIRLNLSKKDARVGAVRFGVSPEAFPFPAGSILDLAVSLDANVYMGETRVSILVKNVRFSALGGDDYLMGTRAYAQLSSGAAMQHADGLVPDRAFVGDVYKTLRGMGGCCRSTDELCVRLGKGGGAICSVLLSVDALCELGLAVREEDGTVRLTAVRGKVNLDDSVVLRNARKCLR